MERNRHTGKGQEENLSGTFVSVLLLGGFLAFTWVGVFLLFVMRS